MIFLFLKSFITKNSKKKFKKKVKLKKKYIEEKKLN